MTVGERLVAFFAMLGLVCILAALIQAFTDAMGWPIWTRVAIDAGMGFMAAFIARKERE
jgi:hypothetical protein